MGVFDMFRRKDINEGVNTFRNTPNAMLIDVREMDEYRSGHIEDARPVPLSTLQNITNVAPDKSTPLFVYCLTGVRSGQATAMLNNMGYEAVNDIGGISSYQGKVVR